jgi:hypothetical protein
MAVTWPFEEALIAPQLFVMSIFVIPAGQYTARKMNSTHAEIYNASSIFFRQCPMSVPEKVGSGIHTTA